MKPQPSATTNDNTHAPAGWIIDGDRWYVRSLRPGDPPLYLVPHFGFTCEGTVFVREPQHCHDYDRGVITPGRKVAR